MEALTLRTDRLDVLIDLPGARYRAARFDWTTQVRQVVLDGRWAFLSEEAPEGDPARQGVGLAGEFGITTPLGWDQTPVGSWAPKIGVGWLKKPDEGPYRFHRDYEIRPAQFASQRLSPEAIELKAQVVPTGGWGWALSRRWSAEGAVLTLETTLTNAGDHTLQTGEYIHNFLAAEPGVPGWNLTLPQDVPTPERLTEWVNPEGLMVAEGRRVRWNSRPEKDFFFADPTQPAVRGWTLEGPGGRRMAETVGFDPQGFHLWGRAHVVSPELHYAVSVSPGCSLTWTRRWSFQ